VIDLELTWHESVVLGGVLAAGTVPLRLSRRPKLVALSTFTQETALILGLFALWQLAGSYGFMGPDGALSRGQWIWDLERTWHLPSEAWLQHVFLPYPLLIQFFNMYYAILHFPVLIACMIWLFVRHRPAYGRFRTTLVGVTGLCLLVQLVPVAPPRMLPGIGMVDTAIRYHQSVYGSVAGFEADELSAMPSVHVGWAILVAVVIIMTLRSRWRWLGLLYPAMTTLAVVVTANHYWADGIVAGALLVLVLGIQAAGRRAWAWALAWMRNSGLYPARRTWHDPGNKVPISTRGNNGGTSGSGDDRDRATAQRDRSA
jgi:PAP2 superfamily